MKRSPEKGESPWGVWKWEIGPKIARGGVWRKERMGETVGHGVWAEGVLEWRVMRGSVPGEKKKFVRKKVDKWGG